MKTVLTTSPEEAAEYIKRGGLVAFPTETVYGLGADVFNIEAVGRIFEAKKRPADNPLIAHIADKGQIARLAAEITDAASRLIEVFFPGPLTIVLKKLPEVPDTATAGLDTIGVRMPAPELTHKFLKACGIPVVAPSANLSGRPSPTTWQAVLEDLDGRIDCILQGPSTEIGIESTVVDCTGDHPVVLRPGSVSLDAIRRVVPDAEMLKRGDEGPVRSPGLRHQHYAPHARVIILDTGMSPGDSPADAYIGISERSERFALSRVCGSIDEYAAALYEFFRECDRRRITAIYCEAVDIQGVGAALMDRIIRAARR